jgi:hypothetical protein
LRRAADRDDLHRQREKAHGATLATRAAIDWLAAPSRAAPSVDRGRKGANARGAVAAPTKRFMGRFPIPLADPSFASQTWRASRALGECADADLGEACRSHLLVRGNSRVRSSWRDRGRYRLVRPWLARDDRQLGADGSCSERDRRRGVGGSGRWHHRRVKEGEEEAPQGQLVGRRQRIWNSRHQPLQFDRIRRLRSLGQLGRSNGFRSVRPPTISATTDTQGESSAGDHAGIASSRLKGGSRRRVTIASFAVHETGGP